MRPTNFNITLSRDKFQTLNNDVSENRCILHNSEIAMTTTSRKAPYCLALFVAALFGCSEKDPASLTGPGLDVGGARMSLTSVPTEIPATVKIYPTAGSHAQIKWVNTSTEWPIEVEWWVQGPDDPSPFYDHSDFVAAGGTQTPVDQFLFGYRVKGRARYYNDSGVGPWSAFTSTAFMH